jgi:hypothetical protein
MGGYIFDYITIGNINALPIYTLAIYETPHALALGVLFGFLCPWGHVF